VSRYAGCGMTDVLGVMRSEHHSDPMERLLTRPGSDVLKIDLYYTYPDVAGGRVAIEHGFQVFSRHLPRQL
jgi:hypothetical protein